MAKRRSGRVSQRASTTDLVRRVERLPLFVDGRLRVLPINTVRLVPVIKVRDADGSVTYWKNRINHDYARLKREGAKVIGEESVLVVGWEVK